MNCTHEMWEICAAVPDGICPIYQQVELEQLRKAHDVLKSDCAECFAQNESLRALNAELRDALAAMLDIYDHPYLIGQEQRVASCRMALIGREIEFKDKEAFWQEVRAILAKSEAAE